MSWQTASWPSIISFLPTNVINLVINDNKFEIFLLHNCENYRNINFSVINKDPIVLFH